ncbi:hypothetical protein SD71_04875 [Cohnella kolymensis]|uniref:Ankyrin n=1 Tax=Cohnella kolymensis TaxID=1590652 RepID=A0ABR5A7K7_9BACL|nr:ankyrin repeat domain-containing protein [Cohnella kolymensis]KIL37014.1 hypothetical protein SD71_04875 [Cohnella kolymensis]
MEWLEKGYQLTILDMIRDQQMRTEIYGAIQNVSNEYDLLITPTLACLPVENRTDGNTMGPTEINGEPIDPLIGWWMTYFTNFTGHPSASIAWFLFKKNVELERAVFDEKLSEVEKLLQKGADPVVGVGPLGPSIFSFASYSSDNVELAKLFLKYGMDVNARELFTEMTILHASVIEGRVNTVKFLLEQGADPTLDSWLGAPLEIAKRQSLEDPEGNFKAIIDLLTSYIEKFENNTASAS